MVKICDCIMGSGKTSAAISYMNQHTDRRFLYIAPYLDEALRIQESCKTSAFVLPSQKIPKHGFSKTNHILELIDSGRNVATTHQALMYFKPETFDILRDKGYSVIIDEEVSVLQEATNAKPGDLYVAQKMGFISEPNPGEYRLTDEGMSFLMEYNSSFRSLFRTMLSRPAICIHSGREQSGLWCWRFPADLFIKAQEVIVLTYMFEGSEMCAFLKMNGIEYKYIGVHKSDDGSYEFADSVDYIPEYVGKLKDMIHIEQSEKLNSIGKRKTALSDNWYKAHEKDDVKVLQRHLYNYFRNRTGSSVDDRMCGTFGDHWGKIRGKGYWNSNVIFTQKSSNKYSNRTVLAYPVNIFANVSIKRYYDEHGGYFDEDQYALSTMIQWIWRSAIRNGKEIQLYLPSKRMRDMLTNWIDDASKTANQHSRLTEGANGVIRPN